MLHYNCTGSGNPLIFLHGFMENSCIWESFISPFSKNNMVITIDLPGHGKSPIYNEVNTVDFMADKVIEILEFLNLTSATFIGHSMGGYVCLAIADQYPQFVNKTILVNSTSLPDSEAKKEQRLKVIPTIKRNYPTFVRLSIPLLFAENLENEMEQLKQIALNNPIEGIISALRGIKDRADRTNVFYDVKQPFLILNGIHDTTIDFELFESIIPNLDHINIKKLNCAHVAFFEQRENFIDEVKKFIAL